MPQSIRDAIVPGAAATYFEDPDTPDGVLVTRDNFRSRHQSGGCDTRDVAQRDRRERADQRSRPLRDFLCLRPDQEPRADARQPAGGANGRRRSTWSRIRTPASRSAAPASIRIRRRARRLHSLQYLRRKACAIRRRSVSSPSTASAAPRSRRMSCPVRSPAISARSSRCPAARSASRSAPEYRREHSSFDPDPAIAAGLTWTGAVQPESGGFNVKEVFRRAQCAGAEGSPARLSALVRRRDPLFGLQHDRQHNDWKVDGVYAPIRDVSFRATYSQAVRAPISANCSAPPSTSFNFIVDPCDTQETNNGTSTREANCGRFC